MEILARLAVVLVAVNCSTKRDWYQLRMVGDKVQEVFSLTRVRPIYRRCMAYLHPWEYSLSVQPALQALSAHFLYTKCPRGQCRHEASFSCQSIEDCSLLLVEKALKKVDWVAYRPLVPLFAV